MQTPSGAERTRGGKVHRLTRGAGEPHRAHHRGEGPLRGAGTMYNDRPPTIIPGGRANHEAICPAPGGLHRPVRHVQRPAGHHHSRNWPSTSRRRPLVGVNPLGTAAFVGWSRYVQPPAGRHHCPDARTPDRTNHAPAALPATGGAEADGNGRGKRRRQEELAPFRRNGGVQLGGIPPFRRNGVDHRAAGGTPQQPPLAHFNSKPPKHTQNKLKAARGMDNPVASTASTAEGQDSPRPGQPEARTTRGQDDPRPAQPEAKTTHEQNDPSRDSPSPRPGRPKARTTCGQDDLWPGQHDS